MEKIIDELENLELIMQMAAAHFGEKCEVVLHDWTKGYDQSIVAIVNGHVTGRKIGDCGSNMGLEVMRGTTLDGGNRYNYVNKTKDGRLLRCSTIYLKNSRGEPIGAMCINFDISDIMVSKAIYDLMLENESHENEIFANDVNEVLDFLIAESIKLVGKPAEKMNKGDKLMAIRYLDEKGAFLITKSGNKICSTFDISKFTLYNYLDEIREKNGK